MGSVRAEQAFALPAAATQALDDTQLADPACLGWSDELTTAARIGIQTWEHYEAHEPALREWVHALRDWEHNWSLDPLRK